MNTNNETLARVKTLAGFAHRERQMRRVIAAILAVLLILCGMVYVISVMNTRFGSFKISINKYHQLKYGLALCETRDFAKPTSHLNCRASEMITNIDGSTIDMTQIGVNDGVDNGANYLCYTFYCKNTGEEYISFDAALNISSMTLNIERAIRIRLITTRLWSSEGTKTVDYARANSVGEDGTVVPEPDTTPFYSKNIIALDSYKNFAPGEMLKVTVLLWLEGNDPDCIDDILGGEFRIDFKFNVTGHSASLDEEEVTIPQ